MPPPRNSRQRAVPTAAAPAASPLPDHLPLSLCAVRVVQRQLGWAEVGDEDAHLFWCDTSAGTERLVRLARPQRLNHYPGMLDIARKKGLARNLANMRCVSVYVRLWGYMCIWLWRSASSRCWHAVSRAAAARDAETASSSRRPRCLPASPPACLQRAVP